MHLILWLFCVRFCHHLQMGIELGTLRTEGCTLTNCATLTPPFPWKTRLAFSYYLKDRITSKANYNLIEAAQLQSGCVVSYGSWGRSCGMSKFNNISSYLGNNDQDGILSCRMWHIWVLCYCMTSLKAGFVICLNWYVMTLSLPHSEHGHTYRVETGQ